jgi:hypothetical protein
MLRMRCPECGAEVRDEQAVFCARCGHPLADPQGAVTGSIESDDSRTTELGSTSDLEAGREGASDPRVVATDEGSEPAKDGPGNSAPPLLQSAAFPVRDLLGSVARSLRTGGWGEATVAALVAFAGLLLVGLVLLLGAKLEFPDLGAGANPLKVLTWVVMIGLTVLGARLNLGDVTASAFPLGALLAAGLFIIWAARNSLRDRDAYTRGRRVVEGAKIGLPFGFVCWLAAVLFRHDVGETVVSVGAGSALLLGALWGAVFGALGGLQTQESFRTSVGYSMGRIRSRSISIYEGILAAIVMLGTMTVLCAIALLLWIIISLARGAPGPGFTIGDAFAGIIYLAAFIPNLLVAIAALSMGAPIQAGAQVTVRGGSIGALQEFSVFQWGDSGAAWFALFLLLIPLVSCALGGFSARRSTAASGATFEVLGSAASTFAVVLGSLAVLARARLGAGLVRQRGFALVEPDAVAVTFLALLWAAAAGWVGWKLAGSQRPPPADERGPEAA